MVNLLPFEKNISYFTVNPSHPYPSLRSLTFTQIPLALFLPLGARFYSGHSGPGAKLFDRKNPRDFVDTLKQADIDEEVMKCRTL
jgi:hypothetical protein